MIYLDTSVMVSYVNKRDPLHDRAVESVEGAGQAGIVSRLTAVELASVFGRVTGAAGEELEALVEYALRRCGADLVEVDWEEVFSLALEHAGRLRLKTLDLLHIAAASIAGADAILTFDGDILSRGEVVRELLGLRVLGGPGGLTPGGGP